MTTHNQDPDAIEPMQAYRLRELSLAPLGPVACQYALPHVLSRENGYLVATGVYDDVMQCRSTRLRTPEHMLEVIAFGDGRELRYAVPTRADLTSPVYVGAVRLVDTSSGPTLLWEDGQACYPCAAGPWDVRPWMQALDPSGRPVGEQVEIGVGWRLGPATAVGDAVALLGVDEDFANYVIRLVARDGALLEAIVLSDVHEYGASYDMAASPDGRTLAAAWSDGGTSATVQVYDCVD